MRRIDADPMLNWLHRGSGTGGAGGGGTIAEGIKQKLRYVPPRGAIAYQMISRWAMLQRGDTPHNTSKV